MYGQNRVIESSFYLLLKHSLILRRIDRSTNKRYLCDTNFEMHLYYYMNLF